MLVSLNWLKEYIDALPSPKELTEALTMSGTEIESIKELGAGLNNVVTAQVLTCNPHPNADRLQLCEVKTDKETYSIVCGAKNMKPGDKVALALNGAELPNGIKIKKSKIRGVESQGMMCSEVELGIKDTSNGLLILPEDTPLGREVADILDLKDFIFEVGITPNRADLLSVKGLAREISAVVNTPLKEKKIAVEEAGPSVTDKVSVTIKEGAPCRRYTARVIEGVKIGPSPDNIKRRLEAHGIRSINNVVDVTNLVLLELGQPLHAFDLDKVEGKKIEVRLANDGEEIETIDNKVRKLDPTMLVIADTKAPVAVAGVMGGKGSEVSDSTTNILLESAWFEPFTVRRTSKKLGLSSDSSYRFERGVDMEGVRPALDMAAHLIQALGGGKVAKGVIDAYPNKVERPKIDFRLKRAEELLGIKVGEGMAVEILKRLGAEVAPSKEGVLTVVPPSYRLDLRHETDLIEEIARLFGYNNIPTTLPVGRLVPGTIGRLHSVKRRIREVLSNSGFLEVVNYSFVSRELFTLAGPEDKPGVTVLNPLSEEQSIMRDSILPSLLDNLRKNLQKKNEEVRIFEVAPAFVPDGKLPVEKWKVAGVMYGLRWAESWNYAKEGFDFFDVKGVIEGLFEALGAGKPDVAEARGASLFHPGKSAIIVSEGKTAGVFGEIHPDYKEKFDLKRPAYLFELDIDAIIDLSGKQKKYSQLPKFPESARDIAFIVDEEIPYMEILSSIEKLDTKLIERVELFDVYYGGNIPPGKRSMALRVTYRAKDRTLTHQEVEDIHSKVTGELVRRFKAEIRGEAQSIQ